MTLTIVFMISFCPRFLYPFSLKLPFNMWRRWTFVSYIFFFYIRIWPCNIIIFYFHTGHMVRTAAGDPVIPRTCGVFAHCTTTTRFIPRRVPLVRLRKYGRRVIDPRYIVIYDQRRSDLDFFFFFYTPPVFIYKSYDKYVPPSPEYIGYPAHRRGHDSPESWRPLVPYSYIAKGFTALSFIHNIIYSLCSTASYSRKSSGLPV